jgi:Flp pilus assembly CpaF family ATPase/cellulose biosynthesis protein BcsQ
MKKIITFINKKNGSGKTTLALNMASVMAGEYGLKTGVLEMGEGVFDTRVMMNITADHTLNNAADISKYRPDREQFYLFWDISWERAIKYFHESLDVLLIDTEGFPDQRLFDITDTLLIPAALNPYDMKHVNHTAQKLIEMRYPASVINILVNKADNSLLSAGDIQQGFNNIRVLGVLPRLAAVEEASHKGEIYCSKNRKSAFYNTVKNAAGGLLEGGSKPHMEILDMAAVSREDERAILPPVIRPGIKNGTDAGLKKTVNRMLFEEINVKNLEKDALTHPDKKSKIFGEIKNKIRKILDDLDPAMIDRETREAVVTEIFDEVTGLGAIEDLLKDPGISEIMVNRHDEIYIEKAGKLYKSEKRFTDDENVMRAIERIVLPLGRRIDESMPYVDARLPDGSRVNAIIPPLAIDGPVLTIRKFSDRKLTPEDLVKYGSVTADAVEYLRDAVLKRKNILISGGTGSGKTTLLNILSCFIPEDERIITVEDSAELRLSQEHVIRLEARPPNIEGRGAVTIRDLVKNCLRMRPDRIVVGECRGGETLDMLQAMNTGHDGSMTTVHSNTPRDAVSRIEVMVLMSGVELPVRAIREQIKSAVNIIVQQARLKDGSRKITHITEITGIEGDTILMHDIFRYFESGTGMDGRIEGELKRVDRI